MEPLLSIITVTFNARDTIAPTLRSVVEQSMTDWELIIVDGASTDNTLQIVEQFNISHLKVVSEKDRGIYDAMNKGLKLATGRYVLFLNAGDSFHNGDVLQRFASAALANPGAGLIYGQTVVVDANRNVVAPRHLTAPEVLTLQSFANGMLVCHQAFFALRELAVPYELRYTLSADYLWCLEILKKSKLNVYLGPEPIIDFLDGGATTKNHVKSLKQRFEIMCRNFGTFPTIFRHIKFALRALRRNMK